MRRKGTRGRSPALDRTDNTLTETTRPWLTRRTGILPRFGFCKLGIARAGEYNLGWECYRRILSSPDMPGKLTIGESVRKVHCVGYGKYRHSRNCQSPNQALESRTVLLPPVLGSFLRTLVVHTANLSYAAVSIFLRYAAMICGNTHLEYIR